MNIPPVPATKTDSTVGDVPTHEQLSGTFPSNANLAKATAQTINAWKSALNGKQNIDLKNPSLFASEPTVEAPTKYNYPRPEIENSQRNLLTTLDLEQDEYDPEPTIQQLRANYWSSNGDTALSKNINVIPTTLENNETPAHLNITNSNVLEPKFDQTKLDQKNAIHSEDVKGKKNKDFASKTEQAPSPAAPKQSNESLKNSEVTNNLNLMNGAASIESSDLTKDVDLLNKWALKDQSTDLQINQAFVNTPIALSAEAAKKIDGPASVNETELQNLLEKFCNTLYLNPQAGVNSLNNVVLDVSHTLPGTMIEISQQGAFLNIKLYSSDQETLRAMKRDREKLGDSLTASTNLVVRVEAIFRDQNNGTSV